MKDQMLATKWVALAVAMALVVGAGIYVPMFALPSSGTTSTSSTSTCSSTTSSSSTSTTTTSSTSTWVSTSTTGVSYTYSPATPAKIDSVQATVSQSQGQRLVTFQVAFENIGSASIYVVSGCGSAVDATVPSNSPVLQKVSGGPLCACAEFLAPVSPGQNHTSVTPGCWSGYTFRLVQPGTVGVNLTLYWGTSGQDFRQSNYTNITALFTLG